MLTTFSFNDIIFQFLLVRLRGLDGEAVTEINFLSIPSGAIKSSQTCLKHATVNRLSIPSGAIKRIPVCSSMSRNSELSIPSGAIKSLLLLLKCFRFLLPFNSFWCD